MANPFDVQGPTFTIEPPHHLEFTNIIDNHVDCVAKGSPPPKIEWLHLDNTPVTTIPRVSCKTSYNASYGKLVSQYSVQIFFGCKQFPRNLNTGLDLTWRILFWFIWIHRFGISWKMDRSIFRNSIQPPFARYLLFISIVSINQTYFD